MMERRSRVELQQASAALEAMRAASSAEEMRCVWQDFLDRLAKTWQKTKLENVGATDTIRRLVDEAAMLRKSDPLLQYLAQARHADQHSLQVSAVFGLGMQVTLPPGAVFELDFLKGTIRAENGDVTVSVDDPRFLLVPITNRGVTFEPPAMHLGWSLQDNGPFAVAELGFKFYSDLLAQLGSSKDSEERRDGVKSCNISVAQTAHSVGFLAVLGAGACGALPTGGVRPCRREEGPKTKPTTGPSR